MNEDSYLRILQGMGLEERKLFLQSEAVVAEKTHLEQMLDINRALDNAAKDAADAAYQYVQDYQLYQNDPGSGVLLESAEFYTELASDLNNSKYTIKDIRKQREKIQWEVRKLNRAKKITESKHSSKTSENSSPSN